MRRNNPKSGFVLLMALIVLALAATCLAVAARQFCAMALRAGGEQQDLQLRWGALSCEAVCLPKAEDLVAKARVPGADPVSQTRYALTLGGTVFHLIVSDEQAKANANSLARLRGETDLPFVLQRLQAEQCKMLEVRLRPREPVQDETKPPPAYGTFDQLFAVKRASDLVGTSADKTGVANRITCWSSGPVNLLRAEKAVLREALAGVLMESDLAALDAMRRAPTPCTIGLVAAKLTLSKERAKAFRQWATDTSQCHGLWVIAQSPTRDWYRFSVISKVDQKKEPVVRTFTW